jgi:hypothetical protein
MQSNKANCTQIVLKVIYPHQASVFLRLQRYLIFFLTHGDVILDELSLVNDLLHDEAKDDRKDREGKEH